MYWFKARIVVAMALLAVAGCRPQVKEPQGGFKYFDLKGYFNTEAARLAKQYPLITKTVSYNGQPETKTVTIKHWQQELNSFIDADINKPAWRDSYVIIKTNQTLTYQAADSALRTKYIQVVFKNNKVASVKVNSLSSNMLYNTTEHLLYLPDSLYSIQKSQTVRLLGNNNYQITGKFK